jgi:hypothetical protein
MRSAGRQRARLLLCAAVTVFVGACGLPDHSSTPGVDLVSASALAQPYLAGARPVEGKGVCLDRSGSNAAYYLPSARSDLALAVKSWPAVLPDDESSAFAGSPGLNLTIRVAGADRDTPALTISIPPVSSVLAKPDLTAPRVLEYGGPYAVWQKSWSQVDVEARHAHSAALAAARAIRGLPLPEISGGITACVAALATSVPDVGDQPAWNALVVSDLDDTDPAVLPSRALAMASFQIVQACANLDPATCSRVAGTFTSWLQAAGAAPVQISRGNLLGSVIANWLRP